MGRIIGPRLSISRHAPHAPSSSRSPPRAASGAPARFVLPAQDAAGDEERVHASGEVETRAGSLQDFFSAPAWLVQSKVQQVADVDSRLAEIFSHPDAYAQPLDFHPLRLLGIPGAVAESADIGCYDGTRQFRPLRKEKREEKERPRRSGA